MKREAEPAHETNRNLREANNSPQDESGSKIVRKQTKKLNTLDRGQLRDALKGSSKFLDAKANLGIIKDCIDDVTKQGESFTLKGVKHPVKFYGSYTEMLQLLVLRQLDPSIINGQLNVKKSMHRNLKTHPVEYGLIETGQ